MSYLVNALLGALVWIVANVVYLDMKRKGKHGFTRFAAFWVGTPTTWITLFAVRDGKEPSFEVEDDEGASLLADIRRDRALRPGERPMDEDAVGEHAAGPAPATGDRRIEGRDAGAPVRDTDPPGGDADPPAEGGGDGWAPLARGRVE